MFAITLMTLSFAGQKRIQMATEARAEPWAVKEEPDDHGRFDWGPVPGGEPIFGVPLPKIVDRSYLESELERPFELTLMSGHTFTMKTNSLLAAATSWDERNVKFDETKTMTPTHKVLVDFFSLQAKATEIDSTNAIALTSALAASYGSLDLNWKQVLGNLGSAWNKITSALDKIKQYWGKVKSYWSGTNSVPELAPPVLLASLDSSLQVGQPSLSDVTTDAVIWSTCRRGCGEPYRLRNQKGLVKKRRTGLKGASEHAELWCGLC